jgi:hypothetical protein
MIETVIVILFATLIIIYKIVYRQRIVNVEAFDGQKYLVNNLSDSKQAADVLAKLMNKLYQLVDFIIRDYKEGSDKEDDMFINYVRKIKQRLPYVKISETALNSSYTSYSINKGEELVFCIRNKYDYKIHNINELLYVAIHEIAHIGCPEVGHTELFKEINVYLLKKAVCYKIYRYIDYFMNNHDYCGLTLTSTILPDNIKCKVRVK